MLGFDPAGGTASLPVWVAGAIAAVAVVAAVAAWRRSGAGALVAGIAALAVAALAAMAAVTAGSIVHERVLERRALENRVADLAARAFVPGSPLACLDGLAGTSAEAACEAALFGRPEQAAAAVAYVAAQLDLVAAAAPVTAGDRAAARTLAPLKQSLAADRFGLVAHVLALRAGCSPEVCAPLALLDDPDRVRAHLRERPFDLVLARHAAGWPAGGGAGDDGGTATGAAGPGLAGTAAAGGAGPSGSGSSGPGSSAAPGGHPVSSRYDFPSAASIPPVSIMAPEPSTPPPAAPPRDLPAAVPASPGSKPPAAQPVRRPPPARSTQRQVPAAAPAGND